MMERFDQTYSYKLMLCVGWDGKVVKEVMNALNGND